MARSEAVIVLIQDDAIEQFYELRNTDAAAEHYNRAPEEQFAAVKDMRAKGIRMLAIWHSHPETPARMSGEDLKLAYTPGVAVPVKEIAANPATFGSTIQIPT